jgi:hypothetical protein
VGSEALHAWSGSLPRDLGIIFAQVSNDAKGGSTAGRGWGIGVALLLVLGLGDACYHGGEREKDPPPGLPGGLCLAPDGHCEVGSCNRDRNFCFDPMDPCNGFFCGGEGRGVCGPDSEGQPSCQCNPGFNNDQFDLYCCPDAGAAPDGNCSAS